MPYAVLLRLDDAGARPVILRDDSEPLTGGTGVRYRFIGQTNDFGEAARMAESLQRRCAAGEIPGLLGPPGLRPAP